MKMKDFRITQTLAVLTSLILIGSAPASLFAQSDVHGGLFQDRLASNPATKNEPPELDFQQQDTSTHRTGATGQTGTIVEPIPVNRSGNLQPIFSHSSTGAADIMPMDSANPNHLVQQASIASLALPNGQTLYKGGLYTSFDFMFLERSGPSPQALVFTNGSPSLNTTSFTYDAEFTPAATIAIGDPYGYALEFNFFSSANHRFNSVQAGTTVVPVFFGSIPAAPVNSYTIDAQSQLDNYELNQWVSYSQRLRLGLGLRILDLREEFDITETGTSNGFFSITDNELFGGQFAAQYIFFANQYGTVYFQGKSGIYYNRVKVAATSSNLAMNPDSDEFSFVGDLRLVADFPLTDLVSFRAGYQATFLTRVAQGLDQNDNLAISNPTNPGSFDFSTPTYRGGFFGIVVAY